MIQTYKASQKEKNLLSYPPRSDCCINRRKINDLRNMSGALVYLWLNTNNGFWYRIISVNADILTGYEMSGQCWRLLRVNLSSISSFY